MANNLVKTIILAGTFAAAAFSIGSAIRGESKKFNEKNKKPAKPAEDKKQKSKIPPYKKYRPQ